MSNPTSQAAAYALQLLDATPDARPAIVASMNTEQTELATRLLLLAWKQALTQVTPEQKHVIVSVLQQQLSRLQ